jgi:hypothetical protein
MKKIILLVVVFALLCSNVNVVFAVDTPTNPCDLECVEAAKNKQLTEKQIQEIGYGNVIRALVETLNGDLGGALNIAGLGGDPWRTNANANSVYGINLDGTVRGLGVCTLEEASYCKPGNIWGYSYINADSHVGNFKLAKEYNMREGYIVYSCPPNDLCVVKEVLPTRFWNE